LTIPPIIPAALPNRAKVERLDSAGVWQTIYNSVPCHIGQSHIAMPGEEGFVSGETQRWKMVIPYFVSAGVPYKILAEDRITVNEKRFTVIGAVDAEMLQHHWEIELEAYREAVV